MPKRGSWSLAMIVKDEEATVGKVLDDAATVCDELVVVDTGSSDSTVEVAKEHGAQVLDFAWIDDFAAARNSSFEACHGDWILWLDADDRVPSIAQAGFGRLKELLAERSDIDGVMIPYHRGFSPADPTICTFSFDREPVLRRRAWIEKPTGIYAYSRRPSPMATGPLGRSSTSATSCATISAGTRHWMPIGSTWRAWMSRGRGIRPCFPWRNVPQHSNSPTRRSSSCSRRCRPIRPGRKDSSGWGGTITTAKSGARPSPS